MSGKLPVGWEEKKLGEIAAYFIGLTYTPKDVSQEGIIVLRSSNIQNDTLDFADIVRVKAEIKENILVQKGDILMCSRNGSKRLVGKTAVIDSLPEKMTFGTFMTVVRSQYNPYLSWFFKSDLFRHQINSGGNTMINQITKYMLDALVIPFPPQAEQKRIVAVLDEAFAAIAKAKENAEKSLADAREIFESYLEEVFTKGSRGDAEWEEKKLATEVELFAGFPFKSKDYSYIDEDILLLCGDNIGQGELRWNNAKRWAKAEYDVYKKYQLKEKDIVLAMDRPWVKAGLKCAQVSHKDLPALLVQRTACIRSRNSVDNCYIYYLFQSNLFSDHLLSVQTGIGVPHISSEQILSFTFWRPPLPTQRRIVSRLDALSAETKRLEAIYRQKIADLDELKKSILQKAFSGEL